MALCHRGDERARTDCAIAKITTATMNPDVGAEKPERINDATRSPTAAEPRKIAARIRKLIIC